MEASELLKALSLGRRHRRAEARFRLGLEDGREREKASGWDDLDLFFFQKMMCSRQGSLDGQYELTKSIKCGL